MTELVAVVVSDLHASTDGGDDAKTWLTGTTPRTVTEHPILSLQNYLATNKIAPDLILVGGDICNQADPIAMTQTWSDLTDMADHLGATLIATVGNHDLDSRHTGGEIDPRGHLYDLNPPFPVPTDGSATDKYWARNFVRIDGESDAEADALPWRVVTLNSAAFHGYTSKENGAELDFGRVTPSTLRRMRAELAESEPAQITLLLVHHHPFQLPTVDLEDKSALVGAEQLIEIMEEHGPSVLIHGHKHRAYVYYSGGAGTNLWVFSAGSMSAFPYGKNAASGTENQAYILRFQPQAEFESMDIVLAVEFESLSWVQDTGWKVCTNTENALTLPGRGGFGWVLQNPRNIALKLQAAIKKTGGTRIEKSEIYEVEPRLKYLPPAGIAKIRYQLQKLSFELELSNDGTVSHIKEIVPMDSDGSSDED